MARYADPTLLLAEDALVEWYDLAEQLGVDDHGWAAAEKRGTSRILRWHVSKKLGLPMQPFTVWRRKAGSRLGSEARVIESRSGGHRILTFAEPLVRVEIDIVSGGGTGVAMALGPGPAEVALLMDAGTGGPGDTVPLRGSAVQRVIVVGADIGGFRVETLASAVSDEWEPIELVGLPARAGESAYRPDPAGMLGAETDGLSAAMERLHRAAPPIGWPASTPSGRGAPEWRPVDPDPFVEELRSELLAGLLGAFDGRSPHELELHLRRESISGPRTAVGIAPQRSQVSLPVLATALLAAEVDLPVALALGLATGYSLRDRHEQVGFDLMVSAEYPFVPGLGAAAEVATVAPWPPLPDPMTGPPSSVDSRHSGPSAPSEVDHQWTTVVSTSWDRVRPSLTLDRPVAASHGSFDPLGVGPVMSLLDDRPSGGPRPLVITKLPARPDRVGVADRAVELPEDGSVGSCGHAVAVCDAFGVWSHWRETVLDLPVMPVPVPTPANALASAVYAGSPVCSTTVSVDVLVDESTNSAHFVQVRGWLLPATYAGQPPPAGLMPDVHAPPAGAISVQALMRSVVGGFVPEPAGTFGLKELAESGGNDPPPAVPGPRRRWRLTWPAIGVDFGSVPHWTVALWAREIVAGPGWTPEGGPAVSSVSSPVPPVVTVIRPPVPPLGSAPDAEGRSHVAVPLPAVSGATKLIVWTLAETTLLPGALTAAAGLPAPGLADRYTALRTAVGSAGAKRKRFTRLLEVAPGTPTVDIALPRGSREIHLFAVTAVNAADVESAWPANAEAMWAAVAPEVVAPSPPVVTTVVAGSGDVTMTVTSRSHLPVAELHLHATRSWDGARDAGSMGPPIVMSVPVMQADPPPTPSAPANPAGARWQSTVVLPRAQVEGWRGLHLRAVARPVPSAPELGLLGADSAASEVVTVTVPPAGAPDLSPLIPTTWGATSDGVVVRFDAGAPLAASPWGPHTLTAKATAGAATLAQVSPVPLGSIPVDATDPIAAPPALVRTGPPAAGRLPFALWFQRPDLTVPVEVTVSLEDPLGGVNVARVTVPPVSTDIPPDVSIVSANMTTGAVIVDFESSAPVDPATNVGWQLTVSGQGSPGMFFGAVSRTMDLADIPVVGGVPPRTDPIEVVRFPGDTDPRSYRARIEAPVRRVRIEMRAADGGTASDQQHVTR